MQSKRDLAMLAVIKDSRIRPDQSDRADATRRPGRYLHEMVATGTGTTLRWFRSVFGDNMSYEQLIAEGAQVAPGSEGLLCFPYVEGATVPIQE